VGWLDNKCIAFFVLPPQLPYFWSHDDEDCLVAKEAAQGVARSGLPRAAASQNGASLPAVLRLLSSLALMRDFAVALL
jgi:hypothetical protein